MKILLTVAILLVVFATTAEGKLITGYGFKTGVVVGTQEPQNLFAYQYYTDIQSFKWRTGFGIMGYLEWFGTHPLSVITEIGYVGKGTKVGLMEWTDETGNRINPMERDQCADYMILSSLIKLTLHTKHISPYLLIGPRFDVYLPLRDIPDYLRYKSVDFGGNIGVGLEFNLSKFPVVFLESQYNYSFTQSLKTKDPYWTNSEFNGKNKAYQIFLGVKL